MVNLTFRPVWIPLIASMMAYVTYLTNQCSAKWGFLPIIITYAQNQTPIWEIPFPAVTICAETKLNYKNYSFTSLYHKNINGVLTEQE